jgi:hypothetical protein
MQRKAYFSFLAFSVIQFGQVLPAIYRTGPSSILIGSAATQSPNL